MRRLNNTKPVGAVSQMNGDPRKNSKISFRRGMHAFRVGNDLKSEEVDLNADLSASRKPHSGPGTICFWSAFL